MPENVSLGDKARLSCPPFFGQPGRQALRGQSGTLAQAIVANI
jgi:hypothetical protein